MVPSSLRTYTVSRAGREPLVAFICEALEGSGCRILHRPDPRTAPFRVTFETPTGERVGIISYAFLANHRVTRNRPNDEYRFQIKYGGELSGLHPIWQDPYGLYVTLLLGIDPEGGFFVAVDPCLYNPTRFSLSVEFKEAHVSQILERGWFAWERERRPDMGRHGESSVARPEEAQPLFEAMVGGTKESLLQLIMFEREVLGEAPGERHYLADHPEALAFIVKRRGLALHMPASSREAHALAAEFAMSTAELLDLIESRRMVKMAVRGSVAEAHLLRTLRQVPGVERCEALLDDRGPDVAIRYRGRDLTVECKNTSRVRTRDGLEKIDLQRTRAAKADPCSRYYLPTDFDVVAACTHAATGQWAFKYAATTALPHHAICSQRLSNNLSLDARWRVDPREIFNLLEAG